MRSYSFLLHQSVIYTSVFSMKGGSTKLVRDIVREYAGNLGSQEGGEEEGGDRRRAETEHLLSLVDKF